MYRSVTHNIEITAEPFYLADRSSPEDHRYVWGYRITIANHSDIQVKLISRFWRITDANGHEEIVKGPGVIGEQPQMAPGDSYSYSSGCPMSTSSGIMAGFYTMQKDDGELFDVTIPAFSLDLPNTSRRLN